MPSTRTDGYWRSHGSSARRIVLPRSAGSGAEAHPWPTSAATARSAADLVRISSVLRRDGHQTLGLEPVAPAVQAAVEIDAREARPYEKIAELAPGVHAKAEVEGASLGAGDDGPLVAHARPVVPDRVPLEQQGPVRHLVRGRGVEVSGETLLAHHVHHDVHHERAAGAEALVDVLQHPKVVLRRVEV